MSIAMFTNAVAIISRMNKKYLLALVAAVGIATGALSYNLSQARINNKPGDKRQPSQRVQAKPILATNYASNT